MVVVVLVVVLTASGSYDDRPVHCLLDPTAETEASQILILPLRTNRVTSQVGQLHSLGVGVSSGG